MSDLPELVDSVKDKMEYFKITVSDLKAPTSDFVQHYFTSVLEELGVDVNGLSSYEKRYDELNYNSFKHQLPLFKLFGAVNEIAKQIYIKDFSLSDLIRPTPERTQHLIRYFDTFHTYADLKAQSVQITLEELLKTRAEYTELDLECDRLNEEYNKLSNLHIKNEQLKSEINEMKTLLQSRKDAIEMESEEQEKMKSELRKEDQKYEEIKAECLKLDEQALKLQNQLVLSPDLDKLESRMQILKEKIAECEKKNQQLSATLKKKSHNCNIFKKFAADLKQLKEKQNIILELHTHLKSAKENKCTSEKKLSLLKAEIQEITDKLIKKSSKVKQYDDQKLEIEAAMQKDEEASMKRIEESEKELSALEKKSEAVTKEIEALNFRKAELLLKLQELHELDDRRCKMYDELYEKKLSELKLIHSQK